jgi:hypothetical protein
MTIGEAFELTNHLSQLPERELGLDPLLEGGELQLIEPGRLGPKRRLGGEIGEGRAAPQIQRVVERTYGRLRVDREEPPRVAKERLEADCIELRRVGAKDVARAASLELSGPSALRRCEA